MFIIGLLSVLCLSCSEDSPQPIDDDNKKHPDNPSTEVPSYENFCSVLEGAFEEERFFESNEDLIEFISSIPGYKSHTLHDDFLTVTTVDDYRYYINLSTEEPATEEISDARLDELAKSLEDIYSQIGLGESREEPLSITSRGEYSQNSQKTENYVKLDIGTQSRYRLLYWAPCAKYFPPKISEIWNKAFERFKKLKCFENKNTKLLFANKQSENCKLSDLTTFFQYDIVVLDTHGNKNGEILVPKELISDASAKTYLINKKISKASFFDYNTPLKDNKGNILLDKDGNKRYRQVSGYSLSKEYLDDYFSPLKSTKHNTLLWCIVCYGGKNDGALVQSFLANGGGMLCGSDKIMSDNTSQAIKFITELFSFKSAITAFKTVYESVNNKDFFMIAVNARNMGYGTQLGTKTQGKKVNAGYVASSQAFSSRRHNVPTRSDSDDESANSGLAFQNTDTKQMTYMPFSETEIVSYTTTDILDGDVTIADVEVKPIGLAEGKYRVWSYLLDDGEYLLSDKSDLYDNEESSEIRIYTTDDFLQLIQRKVTTDKEINAYLMNDITVPELPEDGKPYWWQLGTNFYGQNHTLTFEKLREDDRFILSGELRDANFVFNDIAESFISVGEKGIVTDCEFTVTENNGLTYQYGASIPSVVFDNNGLIEKCKYSAENTISFCGYNDGFIVDCESRDRVVFCLENRNTIKGCKFYGQRNYPPVADNKSGAVLDGCTNFADVKMELQANNELAGICLRNAGVIRSCINSGTIGSPADNRASGICDTNSGTIEGCSNEGHIVASTLVLGIARQNSGSISNCSNSGILEISDLKKEEISTACAGITILFDSGTASGNTNTGRYVAPSHYNEKCASWGHKHFYTELTFSGFPY